MHQRRNMIIFGLILLGLFLNALARSQADPDLWGYLAFGRHFWGPGGFPWKDVFSYAPTKPLWVYHEWLFGVVLHPLWEHVGPWALQALRYGLALGAVGLTWQTARRRGADRTAASLMLLWWCYVLASSYSPLRAGAFTYFCFALYLCLLESYRLDGKAGRLTWLVPLMAVWVNAHGGFVAGLGLIGLYFAGGLLEKRFRWPLALVGAGAGLVTLLNPYGLDYWRYLLRALSLKRVEIGEWSSIWGAWQRGEPADLYLFFLMALGAAVLLIAWRRRWEPTKLLVLAATAYLGCRHLRHQPFFFMAMMALCATDLGALLERLRGEAWWPRLARLLGGRLAAGAGLVLFGLLLAKWLLATPWALEPYGLKNGRAADLHYPMRAVSYMEQKGFKGNLLPRFAWGEYLLWRLGDRIKVGMDGRYETVYDPAYSLAYFDFTQGRSKGAKFLTAHPHKMALFPPDSPAARALAKRPDWVRLYQDKEAVLFAKRSLKKPSG